MLASEIKTSSDLRAFVEKFSEESHFFDRKTMRFFGDTMRNYGVKRLNIICEYDEDGKYVGHGVEREAFELYRRRPVKHGVMKSAYFCAKTFKQIYPKKEVEA